MTLIKRLALGRKPEIWLWMIRGTEKQRRRVRKMIEELKKNLIKDEGFYICWQANIAMSFVDEYYRDEKKHKNYQDVHRIANKATKNFLDSLIKE